MTGRRSTMRPLFFAFVVLVTLPALTVAQDVPQTPWGAPDLQGNWDFRTITPLQRPEDLGDQAFLTEEEAAQREQGAVDRAVRLWNRDSQRTEAGGNVGGYNNFWMDQGTNVIGTRRTSLIVDPPNGRLPRIARPDRGNHSRRRPDRRKRSMSGPESHT